MKILLNNRRETIETDNITVSELLKIKNFTWKMLVIKINGTVIKRHEYDQLRINDGDDVAVIHLITGG